METTYKIIVKDSMELKLELMLQFRFKIKRKKSISINRYTLIPKQDKVYN